jgi:hypothetical protein
MKKPTDTEKQERKRIRQLSKRQNADEARFHPGYQSSEHLWQILVKLPTDYEPYGQLERENFRDCSCGCRWYREMAGRAGLDWGVCTNPTSPRVGLLTSSIRAARSLNKTHARRILKPPKVRMR